MATVKRCDRCGEIFEPDKEYETYNVEKFASLRVKDGGLGVTAVYKPIDLCDACLIGLDEYLEGVKTDESNGV